MKGKFTYCPNVKRPFLNDSKPWQEMFEEVLLSMTCWEASTNKSSSCINQTAKQSLFSVWNSWRKKRVTESLNLLEFSLQQGTCHLSPVSLSIPWSLKKDHTDMLAQLYNTKKPNCFAVYQLLCKVHHVCLPFSTQNLWQIKYVAHLLHVYGVTVPLSNVYFYHSKLGRHHDTWILIWILSFDQSSNYWVPAFSLL